MEGVKRIELRFFRGINFFRDGDMLFYGFDKEMGVGSVAWENGLVSFNDFFIDCV